MKEEIWKPIEGYENHFVSNYGNIKSKKNKLNPSITNNGYLRVTIRKNGKNNYKNVHRLVAKAFIPNPNNYPCVNHIDGNKQNNNVENLEWCSYSHNNREARRMGLNVTKKGKYNHRARKVIQYDLQDNMIKIWDYMTLITKELGYDYTAISNCCRGKTKKSYGFKWKYAEEGLKK
ncbi:MAG: HNH endonuclease [Clostridia bacterium]|nr:HNH endonuclease [Clostridia bacterium]